MTPTDLLDWQNRLGYSGAQAARVLRLPYATYREYLPGGRRRLPGWLELLTGYVERHGPYPALTLPQGDSEGLSVDEALARVEELMR